jgi:hypothetical protein
MKILLIWVGNIRQKGKPIRNPTARWVFQFFTGIHVLVIAQMQELILNLNEYHRALLGLLGERYQELYSGNGGNGGNE